MGLCTNSGSAVRLEMSANSDCFFQIIVILVARGGFYFSCFDFVFVLFVGFTRGGQGYPNADSSPGNFVNADEVEFCYSKHGVWALVLRPK